MWGCSCDETIDFFNDLTNSKENENVFRLLSDAAIHSLSKLAKIYSKDIDTDVFLHISLRYMTKCSRKEN